MGLSQQTPCDITYMRNLKYDTCELIYETGSQTQKTLYGHERGNGVGRDKLGVWDQEIQTTMYKVDKQQGPTCSYKEQVPTGNYI